MSGILGQLATSAEADLYTCPPRTIATLKVIISNRGAATTFQICVAVNGEAGDVKQDLASNTNIAANEPRSSVSFVISSGDVIRVSAGSANVSFTATGETRAEN